MQEPKSESKPEFKHEPMTEKAYREVVDQAFKKLERAFDDVDPDEVEYSMSQGAVTLLFADKTKCILSTQPSVRQIWLAAAAKGIAFHFDYDQQTRAWTDDKGKGVELFSYIKGLVREAANVDLNLKL